MTRAILAGLSPRDRRALAWGAALLGPALCWGLVVRPLLAAREASHAALVDQRALLAREVALLGEASRAPEAARRAAAVLRRESPRLFAGPDPVIASAALARYIGDAARESRVLADRLESLTADSAVGGFVAVRVVLHGQGDVIGAATLLRALETGRKLVRVDNLVLEPLGGGTTAAAPGVGASLGADQANATPEAPEVLAVTLTVTGFAPVALPTDILPPRGGLRPAGAGARPASSLPDETASSAGRGGLRQLATEDGT